MTEKRYWLVSGFYTLFQRFSVLLFNFGSFYLILGMFTPEENGVWALFMTIGTNFIELSRAGLIQNGLVRYLSVSHQADHSYINTASLLINFIFTGVVILLLLFTGLWLEHWLHTPSLALMLFFYIPTSLILIPYIQFQSIQQANLDFKGIFWGNFIRQGFFFMVILVFSLQKKSISLVNLVNLQTMAALAGTLTSWFFARKFLKFSVKIDKVWFQRLFDYGRFGLVTNLSTTILGSIDSFMLGTMIGTRAVAIQNVALRITNMAEVPTNAMADIVFPQSARRIETQGREGVKYLYEKAVGILLALIVPAMLFIWLFPQFIILIIAKEKFIESASILQVTALYTMLMPFGRQGGTLLDATGKQKLNSRLVLMSACINLVANYIFIKQFGIIGASYGTLFTCIVGTCIQYLFLRREANVSLGNVFRQWFYFYGEAFEMVRKRLKK
jgi:O-antigen/teichoic acid export membrane protein